MKNIFSSLKTAATNHRVISGGVALGAGVASVVAYKLVSGRTRTRRTRKNLGRHFSDQANHLRTFEPNSEQRTRLQESTPGSHPSENIATTAEHSPIDPNGPAEVSKASAWANRQLGSTPTTATVEAPFIQG